LPGKAQTQHPRAENHIFQKKLKNDLLSAATHSSSYPDFFNLPEAEATAMFM